MNHIHPLDPPAQHHAAGRAGHLAAQGLVDGPPLLAAIVQAAQAAHAAAPRADPSGLAMRLHHRFADAAADTARARAAASRAIGFALAPLLDRRAPGEALLAAAHEADPACVLTAGERTALVEDAILRRLRAVRRGGIR